MFILKDSQKAELEVVPVSAAGNIAEVDGAVTFAVTDEAILALTITGPRTAIVTAVGPVGIAQVTCSADALVGEGEVIISGIVEVQVIAGAAATIAINPVAITEK